jgi:glycine oxidase
MKTYDAVIAGGGIIGASVALELAEVGLRVALFDARQPGREASWASGGMISPAPEHAAMIPYLPISLASVALYPDFIRRVEELSGLDVGYRRRGALDVLLDGNIDEEVAAVLALQHGAGLKAEALTTERVRALEPSLSEKTQAAILRPDEACLNTRAFTAATLKAAQRKGVELHGHNGARALSIERNRCKGLLLENDRVEAAWTIVAAGCFSSKIEGAAAYAPVTPAKGQMIALRCESAPVEHILWLEHKYLVPQLDGRIIAGSTIEYAGFDHEVTAGGMELILREVIRMVPGLASARIEETWAGLRPDSPDHLPIIGPTDLEGLLIATGHFRSGILLAPVTARLVRDWVTAQKVNVDWSGLSPMRFLESQRALHSKA